MMDRCYSPIQPHPFCFCPLTPPLYLHRPKVGNPACLISESPPASRNFVLAHNYCVPFLIPSFFSRPSSPPEPLGCEAEPTLGCAYERAIPSLNSPSWPLRTLPPPPFYPPIRPHDIPSCCPPPQDVGLPLPLCTRRVGCSLPGGGRGAGIFRAACIALL